jgi:hypothetical protein
MQVVFGKAGVGRRRTEAASVDPNTREPEKLLPLLKQYPPHEMEFYPDGAVTSWKTMDSCAETLRGAGRGRFALAATRGV